MGKEWMVISLGFDGPLGSSEPMARQTRWVCKPTRGRPWIVGYTPERAVGGGPDFDGKFLAFAYRPVGKDAWKRVYVRGFRKRTDAKKRALKMYRDHSSADRRESLKGE